MSFLVQTGRMRKQRVVKLSLSGRKERINNFKEQ